MAARCATEAFSTTCAVHIKGLDGRPVVIPQCRITGSSSQASCHTSVSDHWQFKPGQLSYLSVVSLAVQARPVVIPQCRITGSSSQASCHTSVSYHWQFKPGQLSYLSFGSLAAQARPVVIPQCRITGSSSQEP